MIFPITERFPYVNFAMFQGDDSKVMDDFINPGPELMAALIDAHGPPGHQINFPGNSYKFIIPALPSIFYVNLFTLRQGYIFLQMPCFLGRETIQPKLKLGKKIRRGQ